MDMTIGQLKVGTPLILGRYSVRNDARPAPIVWLKATPNSDFITQCAVDFLCLDARERNSENTNHQYHGNPSCKKSNIYNFLNSDAESWFVQMHEHDAPPSYRNGLTHAGAYDTHYGFLYYFQDSELQSILRKTKEVNGEVITSQVRLPSMSEMVGDDRLTLFKKKGARPKATEDMLLHQVGRRLSIDENSFVPFWLTDPGRYEGQGSIFSRSCCRESEYPNASAGVRPMCTLNPDTVVVVEEDGFYHIKPYAIRRDVCTDEELFALLGMMQP